MSDAMQTVPLRFKLNGAATEMVVPTNLTLADLLREVLDMKGTRVACERAVCGACTILIDGSPVASCATFAFEIDGTELHTIEGLEGPDGELDPVQETFIEYSAFQCGYCTSGMILLTKALLAEHPDPDRATVVEWLSSSICRCTGYTLIIEAVLDAARRIKRAKGSAR